MERRKKDAYVQTLSELEKLSDKTHPENVRVRARVIQGIVLHMLEEDLTQYDVADAVNVSQQQISATLMPSRINAFKFDRVIDWLTVLGARPFLSGTVLYGRTPQRFGQGNERLRSIAADERLWHLIENGVERESIKISASIMWAIQREILGLDLTAQEASRRFGIPWQRIEALVRCDQSKFTLESLILMLKEGGMQVTLPNSALEARELSQVACLA